MEWIQINKHADAWCLYSQRWQAEVFNHKFIVRMHDVNDPVNQSYMIVLNVDGEFDILVDFNDYGVDYEDVDWRQEWTDVMMACETVILNLAKWKLK